MGSSRGLASTGTKTSRVPTVATSQCSAFQITVRTIRNTPRSVEMPEVSSKTILLAIGCACHALPMSPISSREYRSGKMPRSHHGAHKSHVMIDYQIVAVSSAERERLERRRKNRQG